MIERGQGDRVLHYSVWTIFRRASSYIAEWYSYACVESLCAWWRAALASTIQAT